MRNRHVGDREKIPRHGYRRFEARLESRFIPARKDSARVGRLQFGRDHPLAAVCGRIVDVENAAAEPVEMSGECDAELVRPRRERVRKNKRNGLGLGRRRNYRHLPRLALKRRGGKRHIDRVQDQAIGRRDDFDVDHLGAADGKRGQVGLEIDRVVRRHDVLRQPARRRGKGIGGFGARDAAACDERRDERQCDSLDYTNQG